MKTTVIQRAEDFTVFEQIELKRLITYFPNLSQLIEVWISSVGHGLGLSNATI
jgi:hypothetical protein